MNECHDITLDLKEIYIDNGKVLLDPCIKHNGILKQLKKMRIIRNICGNINYKNVDIPIATINMGILRKYDYVGVNNHLCKTSTYK